jgi:hypothetical protein
LKLEEVTSGASLEGVEPATVVTVVAAIAIPPDSLQLIYRLPDGALRERLLSRADEGSLVVATVSRPEDGSVEGPSYLRNPFDAEPGWGGSSINFEIKAPLARGGNPG